MLRTHRAGKGVGFSLNGTEGAQAFPQPLVSEDGEPHQGVQQASWAQVGRRNLSSPLLLLQSRRSPHACLSCSPLGLLPMPPKTNVARRDGGLGGQGTGLGAQQALWA